MENPRLKIFHDEILLEATIDELQERMESGEVTSKELVLLYMQRIGQMDRQGSAINSVLEINPDALHIDSCLIKG